MPEPLITVSEENSSSIPNSDVQILSPAGVPVTVNAAGDVVKAPDPVLEAAKREWSDLSYLGECYNNFLVAVQIGAKKDYQYNSPQEYEAAGRPRWDENSSFMEWCRDQEEHLAFRIEELAKKYKGEIPADRHLTNMLWRGEIDNPSPYLGKVLGVLDYEIYEWILRKGREALQRFRTGTVSMVEVRRYADIANR